jgi:hypothetical protein
VDCSGRHLTPAGNRGKVETPQTERRGGPTSSPGNLVPGAERNGQHFVRKSLIEETNYEKSLSVNKKDLLNGITNKKISSTYINDLDLSGVRIVAVCFLRA